MKKTKTNNSGFTLIELIIAMAILAFLMTAVSSFMGSGVLSYKKSKADITVHNSAQETYNQLMDSIMQANGLIIYGYPVNTATDPVTGDVTLDKLNFIESGVTSTVGVGTPTYYVKDDAAWTAFKSTPECKDPTATVVYFENLPKGSMVYAIDIITDSSIEFDPAYATTQKQANGKYTNAITNETDVVIETLKHKKKKPDGTTEVGADVVSVLGDEVYNINDTQRNIFSFEEENMYYERRYAFMTALNDYYIAGTNYKSDFTYSESFAFVQEADGPVTGCAVTINAADEAIGIDLYFSDKNMTYTTKGMVNIRNSYVLTPKK